MVKEDVTNLNKNKDRERYISVREAAEEMGYSRIHVVRLINSGKIKAKKVGRSFVVDRNSIGGVYAEMSSTEKMEIDVAVKRIMDKYGDAIKKLGKE